MNRIHRSRWRIPTVALTLLGVFLLWWGITSLASPSYVPNATFDWLDRTLTQVNQYVWVLAAGVSLVTVGMLSSVSRWVRDDWRLAALVGVVGVGFLSIATLFALVTLNPVWGAIYVSPAFFAGLYALGCVYRSHT